MIPYDDNVLINTELLSIIQMNEGISSIIHDNYRALTRRINFHMQGGGMRRSGGYVD